MCLSGSASSVDQHAKRVSLKDIAKGKQPPATILAWRTWGVPNPDSLNPNLRSATASSIWTPGKPMKTHAEIKVGTGAVGVHAYKTIEDLFAANMANKTDFKQRTTVVGQIVLWGKIADHANGYRAEFGYPFQLFANGPGLVVRLADIYGCSIGRDFIPRLAKAA